jgi:hypothetical protein
VHCAIGQQSQDGRADVATLPASASAASAAWAAETEASARIEAAAAGSESEAGLEAGAAERAVPVSAVLTDVFPEITTGVPPVVVQGASLLRIESEAESTWWWCEWVIHGERSLSSVRKHLVCFRYVNDISESIVMQRRDLIFSKRHAGCCSPRPGCM